MYKQIVLLLVCTNFHYIEANFNSVTFNSVFDLLEDARNELEKLNATVLGAILEGHNNLNDLYTDIEYYQMNTESSATLALQNVKERVEEEINVIVELATAEGIDASYCLSRLENYFDYLLTLALNQLGECISDEVGEGAVIVSDATYLVDVTITVVHQLDYQLGLCANNEACISPLYLRIEQEREKIPQEIKVEVLRATELFEKLKLSIQGCADLKLSQYNDVADSTMKDFRTCLGLELFN